MKKLVKESLLLESPDKVTGHDGKEYEMNMSGHKSYAFEVILNTEKQTIADVLIANKPNDYHGSDTVTDGPISGMANKTRISSARSGKYPFDWEKIYPGRIYMTPKIITFWVYPSEKELKKIIRIMEKKMKIQMVDNDWFIEVYSSGMKQSGTQSYANNYNRDSENKELIPVEKFVGSKKPPEKEYIQHLDTKHKHKVPAGFGSKNPDYMKKRQWQMASVASESLRPLEEDKTLGLKKRTIKVVKDTRGDEVKICLVNGDYVTSEEPGLGFKEFVEGGHHYVTGYPGYKLFIPEDEIWIDDIYTKEPEKMKGIIQHEFIERNLMKYKGWNYSDAHEYANKKEAELRKKSEK